MAKRVAAPRYPVLNLGNVGTSPPAQPALNTQASALAHNDLVAQLKAITDQQAADRAAGRATADQILQASQGGADFLKRSGLAGDVQAQDYARAVAETKSLAGGYSGQLRTDALNAAQAAGTALHAIPGNTQPVTADRGGPLANLLYGLQGSLPGQALVAQGLGSVAAARGQVPSALASGQLQALGAVQAANQQAARLDPQIAAAEGKLPGLTRSYLGDLVKQQQAAQAAESLAEYRNRPTIRSSGGGIYSVGADGTITTLREPPATASSLNVHYGANGEITQILPNGKIVTVRAGTTPPPTPHYTTVTDKGGTYVVNEDTGERRRVAGPSATASGVKTEIIGSSTSGQAVATTHPNGTVTVKPLPGKFGKPSASSKSGSATLSPSAAKGLATEIRGWKSGYSGTDNGVPQYGGEKLSYTQAVTRALAQAPATAAGKRKALSLVNAEYGTPQTIALQTARDAKDAGHGLTEAATILLQTPDRLPNNYYIDALARIYRMSAADVRVIFDQLGQLIASGQVPSAG